REALPYRRKLSPVLRGGLATRGTRGGDAGVRVKLPVRGNCVGAAHGRRAERAPRTPLPWLRRRCARRRGLTTGCVPFPATQYAPQYSQQWRSEIEFNAGECAIQFHSKWLDEGLHNTNPHILNMMKREVEEQYRKLARSGALSERIRKAFTQNKIRLNANQQEVADYFHISARTLNRHLHREDTSLKQIVTSVRLETTRHLLTSTDDSIEQIAL